MSKEAKKEVVVCDGKDQDNTTYLVRICCVYQGGQKEGHYLKFVDKEGGSKKLISDAKQEDKSKIKLETFIDDDGIGQLCLIIDSNSTDRALRLKEDDGKYSFTVEENRSLADEKKLYKNVKKELADFLFKKEPKTGKNEFYLYNTTRNGKSFFLAVGEDGSLRMDSPPEESEVDRNDNKYLFKIH